MKSFRTEYQNCQKLQSSGPIYNYCMLAFFFKLLGSPSAPEAIDYKITVSLRVQKATEPSPLPLFGETQPNAI